MPREHVQLLREEASQRYYELLLSPCLILSANFKLYTQKMKANFSVLLKS